MLWKDVNRCQLLIMQLYFDHILARNIIKSCVIKTLFLHVSQTPNILFLDNSNYLLPDTISFFKLYHLKHEWLHPNLLIPPQTQMPLLLPCRILSPPSSRQASPPLNYLQPRRILHLNQSRIFDLVAIILSIVHFFTFILTVNSMKNHFTAATIAVHSLCMLIVI